MKAGGPAMEMPVAAGAETMSVLGAGIFAGREINAGWLSSSGTGPAAWG